MSFFKNVFGGKQQPKKSAAEQTISSIQQLGEREEQLEKRKALLEKRVNEEVEKAKQFTKDQKKSQALMCLKKKKMYSDQIQQVENLILRINEQRIMLESQRTTVDIVNDMKNASQAAKQTMKEFNIDNVDQVMDDIAETNAELSQMQEALGQPVGLAADIDEDDLLNELGELEAQTFEEQMLEPAPVPTKPLPSVPAQPAAAAAKPAKTQEELELEELQKEMAMEAA